MVMDGDSMVDLHAMREGIDSYLARDVEATSPTGRAGGPTLATWGTSPDAAAGQDAMMRLLG